MPTTHAWWPGVFRQLFAILAICVGCSAYAQQTGNPPASSSPTFSDAQLDQMLAPIALYPDALLSQVLMASTYPADVKAAVEWSKAHPDDKGDAAVKKVENESWEPSVQSLVAFPQVLSMMGAKPDDVQNLGDAFLADPGRVMDRVQFLRKKAEEAGNLKSNEHQKVSTQTEGSNQVIVVEPAQPQSVYVPVYQPTVVYGSWWWPSYPPYYWPPPPYYYPTGGFVAGMVWGAAIVGISNGLWGGFNWGHGDVNINVNKFNNINVNKKLDIGNTGFKHNPERRGNVPYRDQRSREQFGNKGPAGRDSREAYRGKDGRDDQRARANDALQQRGFEPAATRDHPRDASRDRAGERPGASDRAAGGGDRLGGGGDRFDSGRGDSGGFDRGSGGSRDNALSHIGDHNSRAASDRGQAARNSMSQHGGGGFGGAHGGGGARSGGFGGGGARGGGGGGRRR
ncbi:DUF3300 domain-containing protein [Uliginosibacterium sp. H1]|uniref:DUF3300 domain-containing protein n=1 Tax=Uliginosibacterium sp. H1 TaxID=3114757 RepID=UPI002E180F4F|nr:DUF3300 domain-containing protein [Uliginosibacterium sp. H1]